MNNSRNQQIYQSNTRIPSGNARSRLAQNNPRHLSGAQSRVMSSAQRNNVEARKASAAAQKYISNPNEDSGLPPDVNEVMNIQPYKKQYIHGVPGSSPVIRPQNDLNYHQKQGKGPLMERAERLKRLQELKENIHVR